MPSYLCTAVLKIELGDVRVCTNDAEQSEANNRCHFHGVHSPLSTLTRWEGLDIVTDIEEVLKRAMIGIWMHRRGLIDWSDWDDVEETFAECIAAQLRINNVYRQRAHALGQLTTMHSDVTTLVALEGQTQTEYLRVRGQFRWLSAWKTRRRVEGIIMARNRLINNLTNP